MTDYGSTVELCALMRYCGLGQTDLAELAAAPLTAVRGWLKGESAAPAHLFEALDALAGDLGEEIDRLAKAGAETGTIPVARSNESLRAGGPHVWAPPPRGKATGAFAGLQQIAALSAQIQAEDLSKKRPALVWAPE